MAIYLHEQLMKTFRNHPDNSVAKPNFYLPRDTGETRPVYDEQGVKTGTEPVIAYDTQVRQDIDPVLGIITYTRKSKLGIQQIAITSSDVTLYNGIDEDNLLPVMTQNVTLETSTDGITWASEPTVDRVIDADGDGLIDYLISTGASGYLQISSIYNWFTEGSGKQTYEFACPGKLGRVKLTCTIYDDEQAIINIDDFDGPVEYTLTDDVAEWIFYPEGIADGGVVDPYLSITETSTYIDVFVDDTDNTNYVHIKTYDSGRSSNDYIELFKGGTERMKSRHAFEVGNTPYSIHYDAAATMTVLGDTPVRAVLLHQGTPTNSSGTALSNVTSYQHMIYIYPMDSANRVKIFVDIELVQDASITHSDAQTYPAILACQETSLSNDADYHEASGSEASSSDGNNYDSAEYLTRLGDEMTGQLVLLSDSTGLIHQRAQTASSRGPRLSFLTGSTTSGTHTISGLMIYDFDGKGATDGTYEADRLTLGSQYYKPASNANLATIADTLGAFAVPAALQIPTVDEIGTDGAYHLDGSV